MKSPQAEGFLKRPVFTAFLTLFAAFFILAPVGCSPNNPYRSTDKGKDIFYTTFNEPPKHLDPARSYSSDEYDIIALIYEPPLQYHYLKRPYTVIPLTAEKLPTPAYYAKTGARLPQDAPPEKVEKAVYEIKLKKGILYEPHPAFAKRQDGAPSYSSVSDATLEGISEARDFPLKGTRELTADDYIYQIKRLADPQLESPIFSIIERYVLGLTEYSQALKDDLDAVRKKRKETAGPSYNRDTDEKENPIILDYGRHELPGVEKVDAYTYKIILKTKYPQFIYWLTLPFFSPMPIEADLFYKQAALMKKNITLDRFPVGTGPYRMGVFRPNMEMVLAKNENFHEEFYPSEGEPEDEKAGLLRDAGKRLPFMERLVFKLEKEAIPRWNKFLQGYYDNSGLTSDSFDQAITFGAAGKAELTEFMKDKGIRLLTAVRPATYYSGFNMLDDAVGGGGAKRQKLRQAISIALDFEEYIEIFNNGRGIPAMSVVPSGIFGYDGGAINPYVYTLDTGRKRPVRRTIEYAKRLLTEAGYPEGRDSNGAPLIVTFDNPWTGADTAPVINWYIKRFKLLGIQLENRTTDYNRFQEKMRKGNFQFFSWGWNADYPDPENFLFLLASANGKVKFGGENVSNYTNPDYDRLFRQMENMDNGAERLRIIKEMIAMIQKDSPWVWGYHPVVFGLFHQWVENVKFNPMANNAVKYLRLNAGARSLLRGAWNGPVVWPVFALIAALAVITLPVVISVRKRAARKRNG
ncbi:MAG: ABC transporter substrate-binding protein [Deltaproteobacteria bacterium]|nr:ABC transporter substrate-binding protein [Deltaproteobacteria bacterium]